MIATCVYVHVKNEFLEQFISATKLNHENSVKEPGNLRFDILQQASDPCRFTFYEVYIDEKAVLAHKETEHYKKWKDTVEPFMADARTGVRHEVLFPSDLNSW